MKPMNIAPATLTPLVLVNVPKEARERAERWTDGMPTNLVMVSGPSKTSDIQQTLAYGAHGPRQLWVVIVNDHTGDSAQ